ncbi:hypothetical protein L1887_30557 [Cichorium endivia]|nr:hypothetical protein L1887_30557 [Cichorium endivia]
MGVVKEAIGATTAVIATTIGIQGMASLLITISLVFILLLIFRVIGDGLGGANFNPTVTTAFYVAGLDRESLIFAAIRFPAQIAKTAKKHKILVIGDEVYEHLAFGEMKNSPRMRVL